jgi:NhaA family Na+:H+ antiporter
VTGKPPDNSVLRAFLRSEAAGGMLLMAAAAIALAIANGPLSLAYEGLLSTPFGPPIGGHQLTIRLWINDALMALFFLLVGLEIKRELVDGRLSTGESRRLPVIAAASGMIVPAVIFLAVTGGHPDLVRGWAIPAATDIAFAMGVLALLGRRAPTSLKLFLTTVAIADDLGAVVIIALVYTTGLNLVALASAAVLFLLLWLVGKRGATRLWLHLLGGIALWYAVLLSGVHATVAGVLVAATVPAVAVPGAADSPASPLHRLEHALAPAVAFAILPLFGLANAGVRVDGFGVLLLPVPLAVAAGLFLGKQVGIFGAVRLCVAVGLSGRLRGATWLQVYGVSLLCGIGFTMSLFIATLAFADPVLIEEAKAGILLGSFASAIAGFAVLRFAPTHPRHAQIEAEEGREIASDGDVGCLADETQSRARSGFQPSGS